MPFRLKSGHRNQYRSSRLKKTYGITFHEYRQMFIKQKRRCAICGCKAENVHLNRGEDLTLAVDHDHKTGEIRGLLCRLCNSGLGMFKDNVENLAKSVAYLQNPPGPGRWECKAVCDERHHQIDVKVLDGQNDTCYSV